MKILVSACLLGENCKYNGGNNRCKEVLEYLQGHEVVPVCPEVMGGLPIPRIPCEIVKGEVINREGVSCDREYRLGADLAMEIARKEKIDLAILKARSPSCGTRQIYDGTFSRTLIEGSGIFGSRILTEGIPVMDEEECKNKPEHRGNQV